MVVNRITTMGGRAGGGARSGGGGGTAIWGRKANTPGPTQDVRRLGTEILSPQGQQDLGRWLKLTPSNPNLTLEQQANRLTAAGKKKLKSAGWTYDKSDQRYKFKATSMKQINDMAKVLTT